MATYEYRCDDDEIVRSNSPAWYGAGVDRVPGVREGGEASVLEADALVLATCTRCCGRSRGEDARRAGCGDLIAPDRRAQANARASVDAHPPAPPEAMKRGDGIAKRAIRDTPTPSRRGLNAARMEAGRYGRAVSQLELDRPASSSGWSGSMRRSTCYAEAGPRRRPARQMPGSGAAKESNLPTLGLPGPAGFEGPDLQGFCGLFGRVSVRLGAARLGQIRRVRDTVRDMADPPLLLGPAPTGRLSIHILRWPLVRLSPERRLASDAVSQWTALIVGRWTRIGRALEPVHAALRPHRRTDGPDPSDYTAAVTVFTVTWSTVAVDPASPAVRNSCRAGLTLGVDWRLPLGAAASTARRVGIWPDRFRKLVWPSAKGVRRRPAGVSASR